MELASDLTISFGSAGNSLAFLGGGAARSEPDFTRGVGAESHLAFPRLKPADEHILTLDVIPFIHQPQAPRQRLILSVNEQDFGDSGDDRLLAFAVLEAKLYRVLDANRTRQRLHRPQKYAAADAADRTETASLTDKTC